MDVGWNSGTNYNYMCFANVFAFRVFDAQIVAHSITSLSWIELLKPRCKNLFNKWINLYDLVFGIFQDLKHFR